MSDLKTKPDYNVYNMERNMSFMICQLPQEIVGMSYYQPDGKVGAEQSFIKSIKDIMNSADTFSKFNKMNILEHVSAT